MYGTVRIEIAVVNARPFGKVVHDRLVDGDIVVDEWQTFVHAAATENGNTSEAKPRGSDNLSITIGFDLDFFLLKSDKLGVDSDIAASDRGFRF